VSVGVDNGAVFFLTATRPAASEKAIAVEIAGQTLRWSWELSDSELKLISDPIAQPIGSKDYHFPVRYVGDFAPFVIEDGELFSGDLMFGAPVLLGADAETYQGYAAWKPSRSADELVLSVNDSRLPKSAFPYRIDPPIVEMAALADHFTAAPFDGYDQTWDVPSRALTNNNSKAKANDLDPAVPEVSEGLHIYDFGFDLDPQAVITGVEASIDRSVQGCGGCTVPADCIEDDQLFLTVDGLAVEGNNQAGLSQPTSGCWPDDSNSLVTFGGENDTWGATLGVADVESTSFGIVLSATATSSGGSSLPDAAVDFVGITVYWEQPAPPPGKIYPTDDTYLRYENDNTPEGDSPFLRINEAGDNRAVLRFDSQAISEELDGAGVQSATLELFVEDNLQNWGPGRTVDIHRVLEDWNEEETTWN